ncbi:MAG: DMT family transporter [Candidatus Marinimicrobia bacterium]|jgi:drug/metabolite transporter (DMT)-like permease|nr:DMT family transporter [Candidatus Neomarinimicrobiota bacterium]MBT3575544.1 DMT family transporter [Candidatus Neomarinimicrobiota bacterium]MBT3679641.1 DMT family transporter [Candidatus Neomarinimicrobiota bacterium]MBT3950598.1 DMT family transporter [Candidatus Neomarinimicrobiota bacterium]MBT4253415.1 DMT family transporter [Candidatus Neomarinimicrobiota bacterium]
MTEQRLHHIFAVSQALLVTFLWSTSFIIIKWGLADIPPITFAGLRYFLAFLCFLPFIFKKKYVDEIKGLSPQQWTKLILLGFVFYTLTQGTQFLGLSLLPAVSVSLMLNFTPIMVAIMGIVFINEIPSRLQWSGAVIFIVGIIFYFFPISLEGNQGLGLMVMAFGVLANSGAGILGRDINRQRNISPVIITFISMGVGSIILLLSGFLYTGIPVINTENWLYLIWLAVVNTAFAFTLWNHTLRSISAMESSIINGTMLIQIAFLAWFFLDEKITTQEGLGMGIAALGATLVQLKRSKT